MALVLTALRVACPLTSITSHKDRQADFLSVPLSIVKTVSLRVRFMLERNPSKEVLAIARTVNKVSHPGPRDPPIGQRSEV